MAHPPLEPSYLARPFQVTDTGGFNALALELFQVHAHRNPVYRGFLEALKVERADVRSVDRIPFLPIGLFRNHRVLLEELDPSSFFTSSGTTGSITSSTPSFCKMARNCR